MNQGMIVQKIPVSEINPAKYNPRKDLKPGDPAYEKLKRSMTEFGYVEPIIWNEETGNIVGGHQRYKILLEAGHTEVECVVVKLSADKEKALNLALNKVTGDWEIEALADLLHELNEQDFDLSLTGFDAAEIEDLFSQVHDKDVTDDDFDLDKALEEEPVSKPGDIWLLGRHRLICGDSTKAETYEKLMEGKKANLVLTDPPYGVAYEGSQGTIKNDNLQDEEFYKFLLSAFTNMESIMANDASIYVFHADTKGLIFRRAFEDAGFYLSGVCQWVKLNPLHHFICHDIHHSGNSLPGFKIQFHFHLFIEPGVAFVIIQCLFILRLQLPHQHRYLTSPFWFNSGIGIIFSAFEEQLII
jgi:ParB-like chromosome segregation protein Spo0J